MSLQWKEVLGIKGFARGVSEKVGNRGAAVTVDGWVRR